MVQLSFVNFIANIKRKEHTFCNGNEKKYHNINLALATAPTANATNKNNDKNKRHKVVE